MKKLLFILLLLTEFGYAQGTDSLSLADKEDYYEQKIVDEFVVIIDGIISADSLGAELGEISTISTSPPVADEEELGNMLIYLTNLTLFRINQPPE
jgi:hypothetical protein